MKNLIFFSLLIICVVIMATARSQAGSERSGGIANEEAEYYHRAESNLKRARRALYTRLLFSGFDALMGGGVGVADAVLNGLGIGTGDDNLNNDYAINLEH